jgi:hypothetical protein
MLGARARGRKARSRRTRPASPTSSASPPRPLWRPHARRRRLRAATPPSRHRCIVHGGRAAGGAPPGSRIRLTHGARTRAAMAERNALNSMIPRGLADVAGGRAGVAHGASAPWPAKARFKLRPHDGREQQLDRAWSPKSSTWAHLGTPSPARRGRESDLMPSRLLLRPRIFVGGARVRRWSDKHPDARAMVPRARAAPSGAHLRRLS